MGYQVDYDASDHSITRMAYGADGKRLFSCGTSKDGESHVVEWNGNDGVITRNYVGFQKPSSGVVQFDTSKNKYLSVGDDYAIKVWDMDKVNILTAVDAEGGLPLPVSFLWDSSLDDLKDIFPKTYIKDGIIPADKKSKYLDSELVIESCLEPLLATVALRLVSNEFQNIQKEQPLEVELPSRLPQKRKWRGLLHCEEVVSLCCGHN
ncbi:hypothetical protein ACFX16_031135 [Malus domestica]